MYIIVLVIHSWFRWILLASLLFAIYRSYRGWFRNKAFTPFENTVRHVTATISHIQFLIGVLLYFVSPVVDYFLNNISTAIHQREIRFFGMEHITMMFLAIALLTVGSSSAKRKRTDKEKFKTIAIFFTLGLLIIFFSVPWAFSPFTSRPYFRLF